MVSCSKATGSNVKPSTIFGNTSQHFLIKVCDCTSYTYGSSLRLVGDKEGHHVRGEMVESSCSVAGSHILVVFIFDCGRASPMARCEYTIRMSQPTQLSTQRFGMTSRGEERLTFCCAMDGTTCEGPRFGQAQKVRCCP